MEYPEHQKLRVNKELHADISEFYEWLESRGYEICKIREQQTNLTAVLYDTVRPDKIIAEFFDVDPKKLESEKRRMIAELSCPPLQKYE